jgi:hypothetical protein
VNIVLQGFTEFDSTRNTAAHLDAFETSNVNVGVRDAICPRPRRDGVVVAHNLWTPAWDANIAQAGSRAGDNDMRLTHISATDWAGAGSPKFVMSALCLRGAVKLGNWGAPQETVFPLVGLHGGATVLAPPVNRTAFRQDGLFDMIYPLTIERLHVGIDELLRPYYNAYAGNHFHLPYNAPFPTIAPTVISSIEESELNVRRMAVSCLWSPISSSGWAPDCQLDLFTGVAPAYVTIGVRTSLVIKDGALHPSSLFPSSFYTYALGGECFNPSGSGFIPTSAVVCTYTCACACVCVFAGGGGVSFILTCSHTFSPSSSLLSSLFSTFSMTVTGNADD